MYALWYNRPKYRTDTDATNVKIALVLSAFSELEDLSDWKYKQANRPSMGTWTTKAPMSLTRNRNNAARRARFFSTETRSSTFFLRLSLSFSFGPLLVKVVLYRLAEADDDATDDGDGDDVHRRGWVWHRRFSIPGPAHHGRDHRRRWVFNVENEGSNC